MTEDTQIYRLIAVYEDRSEHEETICVAAAVKRCPRAEEELYLKKDEVFMLRRVTPDGGGDEKPPIWEPFLSFTDALAAIRDEMADRDPVLPKPCYVLEKWASKGDFNLTFFRFKGELIEVTPPDEDYHMEQTAHFDLDGDEVVSFRLLQERKRKNDI